MARYFKYFPKTYYSKNNSTGVELVTDIMTRFKFENYFKENSSMYYEYDIQDGDTPEIIASKIYDSPEKHWVVMMLNDIIDPFWDWPLDQRTIVTYIKDKYSANTVGTQTGIEWAKANIKNYFIIETRTLLSNGNKTIYKTETDANTYANTTTSTSSLALADGSAITVSVTKETKNYYDYEIEENEKKRSIKLLKPEFVYRLDQEVKRLLSL